MDIGIEIVSVKQDGKAIKRKTMYLVFKNTAERDFVYNAMHNIID